MLHGLRIRVWGSRREGTNTAAVRWIAWMAQGGNAADGVTTIVAWPHPWFRESSWLIVIAVRFLRPWGGVVAAKLLWALILWGLTMAAARYVRGAGRHRSMGWGIFAGLAGLGVLLWLAAIANALALVQHAGR